MSAECICTKNDYGERRLQKLARRYVYLFGENANDPLILAELSLISGQLYEYGENNFKEAIAEACKDKGIENSKPFIRAIIIR